MFGWRSATKNANTLASTATGKHLGRLSWIPNNWLAHAKLLDSLTVAVSSDVEGQRAEPEPRECADGGHRSMDHNHRRRSLLQCLPNRQWEMVRALSPKCRKSE